MAPVHRALIFHYDILYVICSAYGSTNKKEQFLQRPFWHYEHSNRIITMFWHYEHSNRIITR